MQIAVHYFLALLDAVPKYMEQNKDLKEWRSKTDLNVLQILIQSFLSWLPYKNQQHRILLKQAKEAAKLEQEKMEKEKQEELQKLGVATDVTEAKLMDSTSELKLDKAETQQDNNQKYNYPKKDDTHILSLDLRQKLLKQLISVDFPVGIHIWKNILSALEWHDDKMAILADLVVQAVEQGQASYCLLHYCIARHNAAILFTDPSLILVTLLLGPITANMVEIFANNRDDEFRAKVREQADDNLIAQSWAFRSLTTGAYNCYIKKSCLPEQLDDLICTIVHQRPNLKYYITNLIQKKYGDSAAASRWNSFKFDGRYTTHFDEVSFFSNEDFLSLPEGVEDSEWTAYAAKSRASILQIAFAKCVCILDLDQLHAEPKLLAFFDQLFFNKDVLKIGFQFGEDLYQIRSRVRNCLSLYQTESVICIQQLLTQLLLKSSETTDPEFNVEQFLPAIITKNESEGALLLLEDGTEAKQTHDISQLSNGSNLNETTESLLDTSATTLLPDAEPSHSTAHESKDIDMDKDAKPAEEPKKNIENLRNTGLSSLCKRMLGSGLDKQEQCSVWTRRPLRPRQLRYAALDAYCMLLIYRRCMEWAESLNCDLQELLLEQPAKHVSLPLFWQS
uniref:3'-5' exonuclease domain-containing protein n=1 Tax=Ditylenchus dipsaci TaxID=166011 RepID=A0A915EKX7_9BILA